MGGGGAGGSTFGGGSTAAEVVTAMQAVATDFQADLVPITAAIVNLNDIAVVDVVTGMQAVADDFKADLFPVTSAIAAQTGVLVAEHDFTQAQIAALDFDDSFILLAIGELNNFNPTTDPVANVTLVDRVTINDDMRGTNNALDQNVYVAPDNTGIAVLQATVSSLNDVSTQELVDGLNPDLDAINENIKDASLLIPADRNLT